MKFDGFLKDLEWQLIKNSIIKANDLHVEEDEVSQFAKQLAISQYRQYGIYDVLDENIEKLSKMILEKEEEKERIYRVITENKVIQVVKDQAGIELHEVTREEFGEMMK